MSNDANDQEIGSSPSRGTTFTEENEGFEKSDTVLAQNPAGSEPRKVKFPQIIRHRRIEATIYGKSRHYQRYRLAYYVAGQRRLRTFATYTEAKVEAERIVRELANGSQATALTGSQSRDALAALERLEFLLAGLRGEEIMRLDWGMHGVCRVISKSRLESLRRASADLSRSVQPWPCGWNLSEDVPARCGGRARMRLKKDWEG